MLLPEKVKIHFLGPNNVVSLRGNTGWSTYPTFRVTEAVRGRGRFDFESESLEVRRGDAIFIQPGMRAIAIPRRLDIQVLNFLLYADGRQLTVLPALPVAMPFLGNTHERKVLRAALTDVRRLLALDNSSARAALQTRVILSLFGPERARAAKPPAPPGILSAATELTLHPEARPNAAALARMTGQSEPHFRRLFRHHFGCSPAQFAIRQRLEQACRLLIVENLSVKQTAASLGYPDAFCFSRQFKKAFGYPPAEHRARAGRGNV